VCVCVCVHACVRACVRACGISRTSVDVEFVPDLLGDLGRGDVLLAVQCVDHVQLLVLHQLGDDLDAVPLRQPGRQERHQHMGDVQIDLWGEA